MTLYQPNHHVTVPTAARFRGLVRALCIASALGGVFVLANDAHASDRCTSKPAVCALQKSKAAAQPKKVTKAVEVRQVARTKHCTSKPAVCALQGTTQPQQVVVTEVVREKPVAPACTSKPAICALQASKSAAQK